MLPIYSPHRPSPTEHVAARCRGSDARAATLGLAVLAALAGCKRSETPGDTFNAGLVVATASPELVHDFRVVNTTGRRVRIVWSETSCECTQAELESKELAPASATGLRLRVRLPRIETQAEVRCMLVTDHPDHPEWVYRLRFATLADARIVPDPIELGPTASDRAGEGAISRTDPAARESWLEVCAGADGPLPAPRSVRAPDGLRVDIDPDPAVERLAGGLRRARFRLRVTPTTTALTTTTADRLICVSLDNERVVCSRVIGASAGLGPRSRHAH